MALFKIFNNLESGSSLPDTANQGYCYFDKNTRYFYIDIASGTNLVNREDPAYRVPLNAANSAYAAVALKDFAGKEIHKTYLSSINLNGNNLELIRSSVDKEILALPVIGAGNTTTGNAAWVPAPSTSEGKCVLKDDGTWGEIRLGAKVNGTVYNGATDIVTEYWGNSQNFTIKDNSNTNAGDTVSVNGTNAVTLHLPATIKATLTGNATTATTAVNVSASEGTENIARHIWFSNSASETTRAYSDNFKYNPTTNTLTSNISGLAGAAQTLKTASGTLMNYGSSNKPVYFNNGVPVAVSKIDVGLIVDKVNSAGVADKVANALSISVGGVSKGSYDGSQTHHIDVNAMDLNISGALTYLGRVYTVPTNANITLTTGELKTAQSGNVVICVEDNNEYLFDADSTWINLGSTTSYALRPHIHGNIDSEGFLTSALGVAQPNYLMRTDGTGKIVPGLLFGDSANKFLAENGTWQEVNTDKWQSKLTLNLGNELSGTVSFDGSESSASLEATIINGKITKDKLANGAVTVEKIASDAVITAKIKNANVTTEKLANGAVTAEKLASGAITSAPKLTTPRKINGVSFDGSKDVTGTFTSGLYESYLSWGGRSISGDVSPVDGAMCSLIGGNKSEFANPAGITIEYSTDGGATWLDYGASDQVKTSLVSTLGTGISIGKGATKSVNNRLRVTVNATNCGFYTALKKILIQHSTNGAGGFQVTIEKAYKGSETAFSTQESYPLTGWGGWASIPCVVAFGGRSDQTSNFAALRFTFSIASVNDTFPCNSSIYNILFYGTTNWDIPYNNGIASRGHLYSYDYQQNATFPAKVTATQFVGSLTGNASSATQLANTQTINGTEFNGTAAITTEVWGVARDFKIGDTLKTVNGSNNMTWTLDEIGAAAKTHTHPYLPLSGGTMTGAIAWAANINALKAGNSTYSYRDWGNGAVTFATGNSDTSFIFYNGSDLSSNSTSDVWKNLVNGIQIKKNCLSIGSGWANGVEPDYKLKVGGNGYFSGQVTALGGFDGNASTASKWQTARILELGTDLSGKVSVDGSAAMTLQATIVANAVTTGKIADANITTAKIADANITREKLNKNALYSPIQSLSGSINLTQDYVGKSLLANYSASDATRVITLTQAESTKMDYGFECSLIRPWPNSQLQIKFSGVRVTYNGARRIAATETKSVKLPQVGSVVALKKVESHSTLGDLWLIIGEVEDV